MALVRNSRRSYQKVAVWVRFTIILGVLSSFLAGTGKVFSQGETFFQDTIEAQKALALLENMSPEERVGQLFLVTFKGTDASEISQIYDLIVNYHVGGVVLNSQNDNFTFPDTTQEAQKLIGELQQNKWIASQQEFTRTTNSESYTPNFIPLFIGLSQEGNGHPNDQILSGVTVLPSQMTIGATWNTDFARQTGFILGKELSALGINMVFGPSLDVLENPNAETSWDMNIRTFGGDPFWVGQMGKAYIQGIHEGSQYQVAVIAKHFPGLGAANRSPYEEIPSVRKSLEQLRQIELAPFIAVAEGDPTLENTTDGLLVTHIRYQGLQGNIRATTRPVSLDEQALSQLLSLQGLRAWRTNGGILVSDDLGARGIRRLIDPEDTNFNARLVARDAFLAGNDLLNMGNIIETGDPDNTATVKRVISFFVTKYIEDLAFAQRVDQAVLRILTLKFRLYEEFTLEQAFPRTENLANLQTAPQFGLDILLNGATIISPPLEELNNVLPSGPDVSQKITIFTDVLNYTQCSTCPEAQIPTVDALQQTIVRLYGPTTGGLVLARNLASFSFEDLTAFLDGVGSPDLERPFRDASILVFLIRDVSQNRPSSQALLRLLSERPELVRGRYVIVFSLGAPYYLDTTDITKITALFALYSKTPQAIEVAARILYREIDFSNGSLPVSVQGIGYDLITATSPDPNQIIPLFLDYPQTTNGDPNGATPTPTATPAYRPGDQIPVRTGIILDNNQNPVPDGTPVQFIITQGGIETFAPRVETKGGIAKIFLTIPGNGNLEIRAISEPATQSNVIRIEMQPPEIPFTPTPTSTEIPTQTPSPTPEPSPTVTPTAEPEIPPEQTSHTTTDWLDWLITLVAGGTVGIFAAWLGQGTRLAQWQLRWVLSTLIGSFLVYFYLALNLPGSEIILSIFGRWGIFIMAITGAGLGFIAGMVAFLTYQRN